MALVALPRCCWVLGTGWQGDRQGQMFWGILVLRGELGRVRPSDRPTSEVIISGVRRAGVFWAPASSLPSYRFTLCRVRVHHESGIWRCPTTLGGPASPTAMSSLLLGCL